MPSLANLEEARGTLLALAEAFFRSPGASQHSTAALFQKSGKRGSGPDFEARYRALIEHIPAVVFVAPLELGLGDAYVSPQIETILGFTQEEWLGDPLRWYQQIHPEDKQRWSIEAATLFLSGQPLLSCYRVMARDGHVVWFQCDARMVHSEEGKPSFIHGIGFDVTELKEAEASLKAARDELERRVEERTKALANINAQLKREIAEHEATERKLVAAKEAAEAAARIKSEFLANMSHEIRTPMNGVLGMTNLVLNTDLTAEQREYLSISQSSAESLLGIINQVLDFSKLESGKSQLQRAAFALRSSVARLVKELRFPAEQKELRLTYEIAADVPDAVMGDFGRIRQVLINLIGNAIKFTPAGHVFLRVSLTERVEWQPGLCMIGFAISDTGIGIPAHKLELVFEPFSQADGSNTREYGGTGLGLAISKELVEMMGGRLAVISEPGRGSTFSFAIPLEIVKSGPRKDLNEVQSQSLKILVADSNPIDQRVLSRMIEKSGHSVTVAPNGHEAMEAYGKFSFDLALLDVEMPVMDGVAATAAIRLIEAQRGRSRLPIVGLIAHSCELDKRRYLEAGMDRCLTKPFKTDQLMKLITELTKQSSYRDSVSGG